MARVGAACSSSSAQRPAQPARSRQSASRASLVRLAPELLSAPILQPAMGTWIYSKFYAQDDRCSCGENETNQARDRGRPSAQLAGMSNATTCTSTSIRLWFVKTKL